MKLTRIACARAAARVLVTVATLALSLSLGATPASAHHMCASPAMPREYCPANSHLLSELGPYTGNYVRTRASTTDACTWRPNAVGGWMCVRTVTGWRWNTTGWTAVVLNDGRNLYVTPYVSGWYWTWDKTNGWLAVPSNRLSYQGGDMLGGGRRISG